MINPIALILTGAALSVVFFGSRLNAAVAIMGVVCYVTQGQVVSLGGLHFTAIRIALTAAILRLLFRQELTSVRLNNIDWAVIAYTSAITILASVRVGTSEEVIYRSGCAYDILLSFFVFRGLLIETETARNFQIRLAVLIVPLALLMVRESVTGISVFKTFGGIDELIMREDRPRSQGPFRTAITAGVFGATLIPLFIALYRSGGRRLPVTLGLVSAAVITYTSNSSAPLMAAFCGALAWFWYPWKNHMRAVRWGIIVVLVGLHTIMKVPVWFIFSKLGAFTGGDGYHRSYLIDRFIHFFPDWWLIGTSQTGDWMPTSLLDGNADLTDQYVAAGVGGGLGCLVLWILILVRSFKNLGVALQYSAENNSEAVFLIWGLGAALFAHVVTIFSVSYFDQMHVAWWALVAMIASVTSRTLNHSSSSDDEVVLPSSNSIANKADPIQQF